jgi:hypothetical protein
MMRRYCFITLIFVFLFTGVASAQDLLFDLVTNKVIDKYQNSTCEQLWQAKGQQKSEKEQEIIQLLRNDPQLRTKFINKVAAPIANKMFECGMIP